jgi:hypothetical protein
MMCLIAVIIVIHMWGKQETRIDERRTSASASAPLYPTTGAALRDQAREKNRVLAIGVAGFVVAVFCSAVFAGVLSHLNTEAAQRGLLTHAATAAASMVR